MVFLNIDRFNMAYLLGFLITLTVLLGAAFVLCVLDRMKVIDIAAMYQKMYSSEAMVPTVRHRPFDGMTAVRPMRQAAQGGRHLMPLDTISGTHHVAPESSMPPLGTIESTMPPLGTIQSTMPPLGTIDSGDSHLKYAAG